MKRGARYLPKHQHDTRERQQGEQTGADEDRCKRVPTDEDSDGELREQQQPLLHRRGNVWENAGFRSMEHR